MHNMNAYVNINTNTLQESSTGASENYQVLETSVPITFEEAIIFRFPDSFRKIIINHICIVSK